MGGGSDLPEYANYYGGLVISFAVNLRQSVTIYTGDDIFRVRNSIPYRGKLEFMHALFTAYKMGSFHDVRFTSTSDALLESGLGTSAAGAVATISAISKAKGLKLTKAEIAEQAWEIETGVLNLYGGRQDQYISAFGGFNAIMFEKDKVEISPLNADMIEKLLPALVLIHTGKVRENPKIQEGFKKLSTEQKDKLDRIKSLASKALEPLAAGDYEKIGNLLDQSWQLKKDSNKGVNTPEIDKIYTQAKLNGAYGFKMAGAGGGGYAIMIVNPDKREEFIKNIETIENVTNCDFSIDWNGCESRII